MKVFALYIELFDDANNVFNKMKKSTTFTNWLNEQKVASGKLDFDSYIIQPVQRIPRYQLLIKELLKFTTENHADYKGLMSLQEKIVELNNYSNQSKKEKDLKDKFKTLSNNLNGLLFDIYSPERTLIKETSNAVTFECARSNHKKKLFVYLISDFILLVKEDGKTFDEFIPLHKTQTMDIPGGVQLYNNEIADTWTINFATDTQDWLKRIRAAIEDTDKKIKDMDPDFKIVRAIYGRIGDPARSVDVTAILNHIALIEGGTGLKLKAESKKNLFGADPGGMLYSNQLQIYSSHYEQTQSKVWNDYDPINITL